MRARSCRASTGAVPPEDTATMSGLRSTIAGVMNEQSGRVIDRVAEDPLSRGSLADPALDVRISGGADHEPVSFNVPIFEFPGLPVGLAGSNHLRHLRLQARRDDGQKSARPAQQPGLACGNRSTADDQTRTVVEPDECGKELHVAIRFGQALLPKSISCRPHSRFRPKKRVASADPASASGREVCASPIET